MPLLSKRIFNCIKPLTDVKSEEKLYSIHHTGERFRSQEYPCRLVSNQKSKMAAPMKK